MRLGQIPVAQTWRLNERHDAEIRRMGIPTGAPLAFAPEREAPDRWSTLP